MQMIATSAPLGNANSYCPTGSNGVDEYLYQVQGNIRYASPIITGHTFWWQQGIPGRFHLRKDSGQSKYR